MALSEKDSQPKETGGTGGPVRAWLPKAKSASLWMLAKFSGLWLKKKTSGHFCLNLQCPPPPAGIPTWLERRTIWKGWNETVLSGPEVSLLSWVHSGPSPSPSSWGGFGRRKDWISSINTDDWWEKDKRFIWLRRHNHDIFISRGREWWGGG